MNAKTEIIELELAGLLDQASSMEKNGARLVQICCVKEPAGKGPAEFLELHYSFDINYELTGYKIRISPDDEVPSITPVYPCAFLYENEMHDLFGVKVIGINIDFKGTLYKLATSRPFNPETEKPEAFRKKAE